MLLHAPFSPHAYDPPLSSPLPHSPPLSSSCLFRQIFGAVISFASPYLAQGLPSYYVTDGIQMCSVPSAGGYNATTPTGSNATTPTGSNATTPTGPSTPPTVQDNTYTIILYTGIAFVAFLILVIFFHPRYSRYAAELKAKRSEVHQRLSPARSFFT